MAEKHQHVEATATVAEHYQVPEVAVDIIARPEAPPLGAGEASMGPVIGAIANGIADALGVRLRHWPFTPENIAKSF